MEGKNIRHFNVFMNLHGERKIYHLHELEINGNNKQKIKTYRYSEKLSTTEDVTQIPSF
jgi:hypothetical protein